MPSSTFIAVDWGSTNRRAWLIEAGQVSDRQFDAKGVLSIGLNGYDAEISILRQRFGTYPMLLAGMVGSNRGWIDAGYVACPAPLATLAVNMCNVGDGVRIVPGVRTAVGCRPDVMRGEEIQFFGALEAGSISFDALLCQPGTHSKWARIESGKIASFTTAMVGEIFSLLKGYSMVGFEMKGSAIDGPLFREGVRRAGHGDLLVALFEGRTAGLLEAPGREDVTSFISGLLIGSDVQAQLQKHNTIHLIAEPALGNLYEAAIRELGGTVVRVDSEVAFVSGITRLWEHLV